MAAGNNPASMVTKHGRHLIISCGTASGGVLCISFGGSTIPTGLQFFLFPFYCPHSRITIAPGVTATFKGREARAAKNFILA